MKQIIYFIAGMIILMIVLPLFIVSSKGITLSNTTPDQSSTTKNSSIKIYNHSQDKIQEMPLEEYVVGVVAAEMPADFEIEALKAQAVAARTYAFGRIIGMYGSKNDHKLDTAICTDSNHCQSWIDKETALAKWPKSKSTKNWNKIYNAVNQTKGVLIKYNGEVINPCFHANSGGKTENAENVWNCSSVPYLKSVVSIGEDVSPSFKDIVIITCNEFVEKLKKEYPKLDINTNIDSNNIIKNLKIFTSSSNSGRVQDMNIANISISGTTFRKIFSLKSTNFTIERENKDHIKISTLGYGHGIGMSQWGANYLAKTGNTYDQILKHYYNGVTVSTELF